MGPAVTEDEQWRAPFAKLRDRVKTHVRSSADPSSVFHFYLERCPPILSYKVQLYLSPGPLECRKDFCLSRFGEPPGACCRTLPGSTCGPGTAQR
eukprot:9475993-Pyramimonas_sp.AAC.1